MAKTPYFKQAAANNYAIPAIRLTRKDPKLAALISKSVQGNMPLQKDIQGNNTAAITNPFMLRSVLSKRAKRNADASAIVKLLPDVELSIQILVSSILSPKDMAAVELIYAAPSNILSPTLTASVMDRVRRYFDTEYRITNIVSDMVREALFEKGAYPIAVIPENAIDRLINGDVQVSTESIGVYQNTDGTVRSTGLLGRPHVDRQKRLGIVLESHRLNDVGVAANLGDPNHNRLVYKDIPNQLDAQYKVDWGNGLEEFLIVCDNPAVLRFPEINKLIQEKAVKKVYQKNGLDVSLESFKLSVPDSAIERAIFRTRSQSPEIVSEIKHQNQIARRSVGNPLIMKLPSESVLPVHVPGNPKHHVGYYVLLDEEGHPVESPDGDYMHPGLLRDQNNSVSSNLMRKAAMNMGIDQDRFDPMNNQHVRMATQLYSEMVERDLVSRVKNGVYAGNVSIAKNEEVYRLMLSRVLAKKHSHLLYVPVEYMTYVAFKYGDDGVGRSLIDDQAMLLTIRSVLLFSDVLGSVKNSIGRTKVAMTIDPKDPDPMKTLEVSVDEIIRSRQLNMPLGVSSPGDVMDWIQRAGFEFDVSGHPGLPDVKFEFSQTNSSYPRADNDLQESLRKSSIMGFGLSPETVDDGFNSAFATTAVANNVLLGKRVITWQDIFTPQLTDHCRKALLHSQGLIEDIKQLLADDFSGINIELDETENSSTQVSEELKKKIIINRAIHDFLAGFDVTLPRPSSVTIESQTTELENYAKALDEALDAYLSSDMFSKSFTGDLTDQGATLKAQYKAYFLRKWMAEKNIFPELAQLVISEEGGSKLTEISEEIVKYVKDISAATVNALVGLTANVTAVNKDLAKHGVVEGDGFGNDSNSSSSGSDDGLGGFSMGGDDALGGVDFGSDIDGADAPADGGSTTNDDAETNPNKEGKEGGDQADEDKTNSDDKDTPAE